MYPIQSLILPSFLSQSHWHPFGLGSRSCAGVTLANITIRASLAAIVRNFDIVIPEETTPESMKPAFVFVSAYSHSIRT